MPKKKMTKHKPEKMHKKDEHEKKHHGKKHSEKEDHKKDKKPQSKVAKVLNEYAEGDLHSGSKKGPKVTNRKQAIAIGLSEARKAKKKRK